MGLWSRFKRTIAGGATHSAEIEEELRFHLEMDVAEGRDSRQARLRLGGSLACIEEDTRSMGVVEWLDSVLQDARYGLRQLRRTPALTAAVVLSVAIGVGANTAIFSLVDAAILRPLPVKDPDSLRVVEWTSEGFPVRTTNVNGSVKHLDGKRLQASSVPAYLHRKLSREQHAFDALVGAADPDNVGIAIEGSAAEQVSLQYVSSNYFQGLGLTLPLGRPLADEDDRVGQPPVVIVSHRFWQSRLGSAPDVLSRNIRINDVPARIVGVAPPGFFGLMAGQWTDVYAPLAAKVVLQLRLPNGTAALGEEDTNWWVRQIARLNQDIPEAAATARAAALFRNIVAAETPGASSTASNVPQLVTSPGRRGFAALNPRDANALWILMLLVGVLLLIVCVNVANLLLSRAVGRQRESTVRLALGAARLRLFRQHLIESGVLAVLGGVAGLGVGYLLAQAIHALFQTGRSANSAFDLHVDPRVLGYTAALSILVALIFGLAPAIHAARSGIGDTLKAQTRSVIGGGLRLPRVLVSLQIALCLTALAAAGLLGRTLGNLKWVDLGFDREHIAYASLYPGRSGYTSERAAAYAVRLNEALAAIPGVERVSTASFRPLASMGNNLRLLIQGLPVNDAYRANLNNVGEGYFETMRIPLLRGRAFAFGDFRPDAAVALVDEILAKRFFPNEDPVGRRVGYGPAGNIRWFEIVGVVGNSRYNSLRGDLHPTVYEPYRPSGGINFVIRSTMDSALLADAVRKAAASVDPAVPLTEFHTQSALIDRLLRTERLLSFVSAAFGIVALTLAAIGLGGLLGYAVARRTNEIGVRMALGAATRDVTWMVLRDSLWMVGAGVLLGLPCAYLISRVLKSMLFGLDAVDPWTVVASLLVLSLVAVAAAWVPARRAAGIDPTAALREE